MSSKKIIFWFEELNQEYNDIVGKKCANLGEMMHLGLQVPPGFSLSIDMYRMFVRNTGAEQEMLRYIEGLGELKRGGITLFEEISQNIQGIIESKEMPKEVTGPITSFYTELCEKVGIPDMAVSIRSAGTASRPGMFETYLNVIGVDDVLEKVKKVWASAYTTRAVAFRINKDIPVIADELGIAIPKMINARASGIGFTVDPVTGDDSKIILEANWGLGEGVVSGAESVDAFIVNKENLEIINRQIGNKVKCVVTKDKGAEWAETPNNMRKMPSISDEEILEISRVAKAVEKKLGCAQDMEWAIDQDLPYPKNIFWLQTRPAKVQAKKQQSATDQIVSLIAKKFQR